ncbi:MAG: sigma-54-dependent Fis family transcriptional regulator [Candidatus Eisenbacteria bacterium]|nr:sigma-54-dependent Fis family transcriptional regulator [Candidatus Eisenbacteria bacterium]
MSIILPIAESRFTGAEPLPRSRSVRKRFRDRAYRLAVRGRWGDALDLQRALVLAGQRRGSAREELCDRYRLLRWELAAGRWHEALEQIDQIFGRLARRGASGSAAAGWVFLARAVCYFQLGWGSRFRRTLALVLRNSRRQPMPGLEEAARRILWYYESLRHGERARPAWLIRLECALRGEGAPGSAVPAECALRQQVAFALAPGAPALPAPHDPASTGFERLPELLLGPRSLWWPQEPEGDGLSPAPVRKHEVEALVFWVERLEADPRLDCPPWLSTWIANRVQRLAPDSEPALRARVHRALANVATRQQEILPRATALEALAEVSLWLLSDRGHDDADGPGAHQLLAQARADLGLAAGLLRRLRLDARADRCEERWTRLTWPGATPGGRVGESGSGSTSIFRAPGTRASRLSLVRQELREVGFVTVDPRLLGALAPLRLLAGTNLPVLILGESGTGKEVIARALHRWSGLRGEMVAIHCGAIPRELLESELFGHTRGAFTGATTDKPGLVEVADGGTLFLDEIGEMGAEAQMKLLRVLESGEVRRVGDLRNRTAQVRLVAATHRNLDAAVASGEFRLDLLHRVRGVVVELRPLRERPGDIPELAHHLLGQLAAAQGAIRLSQPALSQLLAYPWPGNVRELRATLHRAAHLTRALGRTEIPAELLGLRPADDLPLGPVSLAPGALGPVPLPEAHLSPAADDALDPALSASLGDPLDDSFGRGLRGTIDLESVLDRIERRLILRALESHNWNRTRAAESLGGLSRTTLIGKMRRLGIDAPRGAETG